MIYKRCISCGNYFETNNENELYCSDICKTEYVRCTVCGNYFQKIEKNIDEENFICSEECQKKYKFNKTKSEFSIE